MVTTGDRRPGQTHWVYGRTRLPCRRCGTPVALRAALADRIGRGRAPIVSAAEAAGERETWWCPGCQPAASRQPADPLLAAPIGPGRMVTWLTGLGWQG